MPSSNNILGRGWLIGRPLAVFALGTILGFVAFYWFAEYGFDFGVFIMNFIVVIKSLVVLLLLVVSFVLYRLRQKEPKIKKIFCWLFSMAWLLATMFGTILFPGNTRHIPPFEAV